MDVEQIADALWRWTTRHPDWKQGDDWDPVVGCVYYEADDAVVLVDPLIPAEPAERDRFLRALDRDVQGAARPLVVVLTVHWHGRSSRELVERYGGSLWAHAPAAHHFRGAVTHPFSLGDPLPGGVEAFDAHRRHEVLLWIPPHRAIVAGDVLLGDEGGGVRLPPTSWLPDGTTYAAFAQRLRPLLDLPVERLLVSHGKPVLADARGALARALEV